jgi:hypothetical protein
MSTSRTSPRALGALAAALLVLATACGDDQDYPEPVTEIDVVDERGETARAGDVDPYVVAPAATPNAPGRIIYEPPTSLAAVAAADTIVRRQNTGTTAPESPEQAARDSAAARAASAQASSGRATGQGAAPRDTSRRPPSRPERR